MAQINPTVELNVLALKVDELKRCLRELGKPLGGRKAELQERILNVIRAGQAQPNFQPSPQAVYKAQQAATIVEEVKNSRHTPCGVRPGVPAEHIPAGGQHAPHAAQRPDAVAASGAGPRSTGSNTKIVCVCNLNYDRPPMIQCGSPSCGTWQHADCMGLSRSKPHPKHYLCVQCRVAMADPFWEAVPGVGRATIPLKRQGYQGTQRLEYRFDINNEHMYKIRHADAKNEYQLWVYSVRGDDDIPARFLWPAGTFLLVNNTRCQATHRSGTYAPKNKTRDAPVIIGPNSVAMTCAEDGSFIVGVQLMKRRAVEDVQRAMKTKENLEDAVQRVVNIIRGPDADDELVALSTTVSLRCPLTGVRISKPARFTNLRGLQAFDLDAFLSTVQRSRKWVDPFSDQAGSISDLQEDVYLSRIIEALAHHPTVDEIEISPEGLWRPCGLNTQEWFDVRHDDNDKRLPKPDGQGATNAVPIDLDDDTDDVKEAAELPASKKRKLSSPVYINLISDDEDDQATSATPVSVRSAAPQQPAAAPQQVVAAPEQAVAAPQQGAPPVGNAVEPAVAESNLQHSPLGPSATAAPSMGLRLKRFRVIEDDSQDDMEILSAMLIPEIGQVPRMPRTNGNIRLDDPGRPRVFAPETLSLHLPEAAASVPPPIPRGLLYSPPTEPQLISASGVSNEACPAAHLPPQGP